MKSDHYYQIQAAIIQAAATLASALPPPDQSEVNRALGESQKDKLLSVYEERFSMAYYRLRDYLQATMEGFPEAPGE